MSAADRVDLYESNGGQLFAVARNANGQVLGGWAGFELIENAGHAESGCAEDDARAILADDTAGWTLEPLMRLEALEIAERCQIVAILDATGFCADDHEIGGRCSSLGIAAQRWLGIEVSHEREAAANQRCTDATATSIAEGDTASRNGPSTEPTCGA